MSVKVSVIIPVYNAEKYITQCIESLLAQTLVDCEFIFINDGSSDNSSEIIQKYEKLDPRVKFINQKNKGVSIARNRGLSFATGEYIGFVDADDFIEADMFNVLFNGAKSEDCDIIISNFESRWENSKVVSNYPFPKDIILNKDYIQQKILPYYLCEDNMNTVCTKLFKNELIKKSNIQFPSQLALGEDGMFSIRCFSKSNKIKFLAYTGYYYREVSGSATRNNIKYDYFKRALEVYNLEMVEKYILNIDQETIRKLKSIKLIKSVMAYIYIFLNPNNDLALLKRYKHIKNMINHENVREALTFYINEMYPTAGKYEKFLVNMIDRKSFIGLYIANTYSRLRNK